MRHSYITLLTLALLSSCTTTQVYHSHNSINPNSYKNKLAGFWLGQSIANWTGLVTEMDKIGNLGDIKTGDFYTRHDWGKVDQPSIWGEGKPSELSATIDFVLRAESDVWGADDDTDIEYMYQHLTANSDSALLAPEQIRDGWLTHIKAEEENYLWVSNQKAFDLMRAGMLPPATSAPQNNEHHAMIDAQLTTEIFGLYAPGRPDLALKLAYLPIRTTARFEAAEIAEFYVIMYSLAAGIDAAHAVKPQLMDIADLAREHLNETHFPAKMYDFVKAQYLAGIAWETTRDQLYQRYQLEQQDGYDITAKALYCNGCFAAGINFAASLVSLFYGEGNCKNTIKIGALTGCDSDNPTATWAGLLGFVYGKSEIEKLFDQQLSNRFNIHRTRQNFPRNGIDTFERMAEEGVDIAIRVQQEF